MKACRLCPRNCNVDRSSRHGYCGVSNHLKIARAALHMWEEPCISGKNGSGTIFFSGCSLGCTFCQNAEISQKGAGSEITQERLREICFELKHQNAHNINLVTPMHYTPQIVEAILPIKEKLTLPIVCNTGGYDLPETLSLLEKTVDCYLPDFKFADPQIAQSYCRAADYPSVARSAIHTMIAQKGAPKLDEQGMMQSGVMVRHLILPGCRKDSLQVLDILYNDFGTENILLSLMSQYTPQPNATGTLSRKVTEFEYRSVVEYALKLGFKGYMQDRTSACSSFTPQFDLTGVNTANT